MLGRLMDKGTTRRLLPAVRPCEVLHLDRSTRRTPFRPLYGQRPSCGHCRLKTTLTKMNAASMIVDDDACPTSRRRLPQLNNHCDEFPSSPSKNGGGNGRRDFDDILARNQIMLRILKMAVQRVLEPPTLHLLAAAACAAMGVAAVEGSLMCQHPMSFDAAQFIARYSIEQLFPSVVWQNQDPHLVARAMNLDPTTFLRDLSGGTPESAALLLKTNLLQSSRHFWAGFMMIAQFIRAASISLDAVKEYERRIQLGREPPFLSKNNGLVVRLCGVRSHVSEVSLQKMGPSLLPVFEDPERIEYLVKKYSKRYRQPVYWCVQPGTYGASYSWDGFPTEEACFMKGINNQDNLLVLEADATNGNDPLSLGEAALDLTIDDASQGFRRILDRYYTTSNGKLVPGKDFRTLRVYLGNSMETQTTGGGHSYTLRHRVRYAKEMDVLVDSRAPVLRKILDWCESVAGKDREIFFQTSSREYFLSLKQLLKQYGYEIYDPLDLRAIKLLANRNEHQHKEEQKESFLSVLLQDEMFVQTHIRDWEENALFLHDMMSSTRHGEAHTVVSSDEEDETPHEEERREMLQTVAKMAHRPRLVHMRNTAETVNAVEALVMAGEVNASNCCALIDRQEGVQALERTLKRETRFVREADQSHVWSFYDKSISGDGNEDDDDDDDENPDRTVTTGGLQIICSSSIHDNLFRQVRQWARMGYSKTEIQAEFDAQYKEILQQIHSVQQEVKLTEGSSSKYQEEEKEA